MILRAPNSERADASRPINSFLIGKPVTFYSNNVNRSVKRKTDINAKIWTKESLLIDPKISEKNLFSSKNLIFGAVHCVFLGITTDC